MPEIEPLQAAEHRAAAIDDLLRLGRGEYEDDTRGRLFQNLEQGVPRFPREHVCFVYDVNLVAIRSAGRIHCPLSKFPRIIHPAVARRIDFHHIQIGRTRPNAPTRVTLTARLAVVPLPVFAVQGHRQNAGGAGLPGPARAGQQVAVGDAILRDRTGESCRHMLLSD